MSTLLVDLLVVLALAFVVAALVLGVYWLVRFVVRDGKDGETPSSRDPSNH